jgi:HSP20 family protein
MFGRQFFNEIDTFQREMEHIFRGSGFPAHCQNGGAKVSFQLRESDEGYIVEAAAPGLDLEKLDISVLGRQLTLSGEIVAAELPEGANLLRQERSGGRFEQSFRLPLELEREKIEASYEHGILKIVLPKAASAQPKKIAVSVA